MSTDKIRIYEIAKKIGKSSKVVIEKANQNGFDLKNHMSCVDSVQEKKILDLFEFNKSDNQKKSRVSGESKNFNSDNSYGEKKYKNQNKDVKKFNDKLLDQKGSGQDNRGKKIIADSIEVGNKKFNRNKNSTFRQNKNDNDIENNSEESKSNNRRDKKSFYRNRKEFENNYEQNKKDENKNIKFNSNRNNYWRNRNNADYNSNNQNSENKNSSWVDKSENNFCQRRKNISSKNNQNQNDKRRNFNRFDKNKNNFYRHNENSDDNNQNQDEQNQNKTGYGRRKDNFYKQRRNNLSDNNQNQNYQSQNRTGYSKGKNNFYKQRRNNLNDNSQNKNIENESNSRFNRNGNNFYKNNGDAKNLSDENNVFINKNVHSKNFDKNNLQNKSYDKNNSETKNQDFNSRKSENTTKKNYRVSLDFENQINTEKQFTRTKKNLDSDKKYRREAQKENIQEISIYDLDKIKNKSHKNKKNTKKQKQVELIETEVTLIKIPDNIVLKELADLAKKPVAEFIKSLMEEGLMVNQNQVINFDLATKILSKFNIATEILEVKNDLKSEKKSDIENKKDNDLKLKPRPPVVVVMGHVDHGKTSLLDAIRNTNVISTEAGGITQHIGAYTVLVDNKDITFLDTPGHEAFTAMRMRGAQATDIAILVVAADDGIMPQTIEAINHAKAAGVEIIVAINKIDKPGADVDKVKQELTEYDLLCEEWGGQTICVPISAKNKIGIENLLEMVILVSEMKELKANPNQKASGIVIEAKLDKGRGPIATVLVQNGTLKTGDSIVVGNSYGKIRAMIDDKGKNIKRALPSIPVEILGLSSVPNSGEIFVVVENDKQAKQIVEENINENKVLFKASLGNKVSLDDLFSQIKKGNIKDLALIIKADVHGSAEAVKLSLERLSNQEVKIKVIHSGVGAINESDVMLASASNAIIIGFNVRPENTAKNIADTEKVDIRLYKIIYDAIEDIKSAMQGLLDPVYEEKIIGHAEVRKLFKISKVGTIAGCYVTDGKILRNAKIRVVRDGINIYESEIASLRREKNDAKEVNENYECGILIEKFNDVKENDILEAYVMEEIKK